MKTYSQFIDEALLPSLIKAAARQFVKSKALQKAIPKVPKLKLRGGGRAALAGAAISGAAALYNALQSKKK